MAPVVKNPPASAGDAGDSDSIPGLGRCPGIGNGNPLQYSCLENPTDRGAWWDIVWDHTKSGMTEHAESQQGLLKHRLWSFTHRISDAVGSV